MFSKKGVSLITVLLFMLVATIAATATYKWLTSEGRSSASRMLQREAYQSAEAGIGAARAWMMHHANDVGALIKAYQDGNNAPIKIDGQMPEFKKAGQSYEIWLTGVNTTSSTYKLKIVSRGKSRNGEATYTEAAILNVDGLYKVKIPAKKTKANYKFDYNYFGGSMENAGNMNSTSMLVNGNWKGNPNTVSKTFVVTGNAELSGNNLHIGQTACIGGNLSSNNGFTGTDLYVVKDANSFTAQLAGDAYFGGNVSMGSQATPGFNIAGNVYLKGTMLTNQGALNPVIHGNMCFDEGALLLSTGTNNPFVVKSNAWLPGPFNVAFGSMNWATGSATVSDNETIDQRYDKVVFAESTGTAYVKYGVPSSNYATLQTRRTFAQHPDWHKQCTKATLNYNKAVCAQMKQDFFTVSWDDNWNTWNAGSYKAYPWNHTAADDKYYIYYVEPGKIDVDYKTYTRDDLQTVTHRPTLPGPGPIGPFGPGVGTTFGPSTIGAYFVGGQTFNYQDLNYEYAYGPFYGASGVSLTPNYKAYHFRCLHNNKNNSCEDGTIEGSPYCKKVSTEGLRPFCSVPSWYQVKHGFSTETPANLDCAEQVKTTCDSIWRKGHGCDNSQYKVDDVLKNSYDTFSSYASKGCAANITTWDNEVVTKMNECYTNLSSSQPADLFNGYLVVSVKSSGKKDPPGTLKGKFIIIFEGDPGQNSFPPTESDSYVFLYLRAGGSSSLQPTGAGTYNYFIFTDATVDQFLFNGTAALNGSIYAKAENCSRVKRLTVDNMTMNQDLLNDLVSNGVLCPANSSTCGEVVSLDEPESSSAGGSESSTELFGKSDSYYVAAAPQLKVTTESQYKNDESESGLANAPNLAGSFIVLPRVVYLPRDPKGSLKDYYGTIPLNTKSPVVENGVTCDDATIKTSGTLYDGTGLLSEGYYTCNVNASVAGVASVVPFYVVVKGTQGGTPIVNFKETSVELEKGNTTKPTLILDTPAAEDYTVRISIPLSHDGWRIDGINGTSCNDGVCTTVIASGQQEKEILEVENQGATSGMVILDIIDGDACNPGTNKIETIFVAASANVELRPLREYCIQNPSQCPEGSVLKKQAATDEWPDCPEVGTWVQINSTSTTDGCRTLETNHQWVCPIDGSVSLQEGDAPVGCTIVIPSSNNSHTAPLEPRTDYYLYAGLKAVKQSLFVGFAGDVTDASDKTIDIEILDNNGNIRNSKCTYASFSADANNCAVDVYRGSKVTLSLPDDVKDFNRWKCESGQDCADLTGFNQKTVSFIISGGNTVYAHFNEKDKHCFFDEFRRSELGCSGNESYCITPCLSTNDECKASAKWKLVEGALSDLQLDTYDKKIKLKGEVTRNKKESEMPKVTVLSSVTAGLYGTLKAQFKISKLSTRNNNIAKAAVQNTGFILRGTGNLSAYLMLNVYLDDYNNINARLCMNGGNVCKESPLYNGYANAYANDGSIVLVSATLRGLGKDGDTLIVSAIPSPWSSTTYSTKFILNNENLDGVESLKTYGTHETVGFRLGDPNFELYGIGWYSEDYNSECWEKYPTVKCSFKANYAGGIVPKDSSVAPWVGLSAWYTQGYAQCDPHYYYNGNNVNDLVCSGMSLADDATFKECGDEYKFAAVGAHGAGTRIAKAAVHDCGMTKEDRQWASENAECGPFWVGDFTTCTQAYTFSFVDAQNGGEYWNVSSSKANLRDATLKIVLNNASHDEIEISMFSKNSEDSYSYGADAIYSETFKTNADGEVSIEVSALSNVEGFDPENVGGVFIRNLTRNSTASVTSVRTSCPNVLSIEGCQASYNTSSGKWLIQALVNNSDRAGQISVTAGGSASLSNLNPSSPYVCGGNDVEACSWNGSGKRQTFVYNWIDDPFANNTGKDYTFTISLSAKEDASKITTCTTDPYSISSISAECSLNKNSVVQKGGLPMVTYSLSGCPDNKCGYEIYVVENSTVIAENAETDNFAGLNTATNVMNTNDAPLEEGTYTIKMRQKSSNRPFAEYTCGEFAVTDISQQQSEIQARSCAFDNQSIGLGQSTVFRASNFTGTAQNAAVRLLDDDGVEIASNPTFWTGNNYEVWSLRPTKTGTLTYTLIVNGGVSCTANLTVTGPSATCRVSANSVEQGDPLTFTIGSMSPTNTNLALVVTETTTNGTTERINETFYSANERTATWTMNNIGTFNYIVTLEGAKVCENTITVTSVAGTAQNCGFTNSSRVYGEKVKFKVNNLKVASGTTWELDDPNGAKVLDGTYDQRYGLTYWETGEFRAKVDGEYTLKLGGNEACTANLSVAQPSAENCRLDAETIPSGNSTKFHWDLKNCKDNQCSYMIKLAGNDFSGQTSVGEQNDRQVDVSTAGEYVVWLNDVATDCKKTLTIAESGTLSCSIAANIPVDEQWQKIKVTSTRPKGKYDVWIDGSIGKTSNGYNMTDIEIDKDATNVEVGGFTCTTSGTHTYKITAHNSTTSLCNGSFTCLNVPKVDCYFLYSSNWTAVSGSVVPNTALQFCASQASISKRTTLTGTNKDGSFSKADFDLSKDGRVCYGFEAPSSDNSYTFSVSANGEEACNDTPILEVATPPNPVTLTYGGSLTTLTAGTWSVFSDNAYSGVLRCKASGNVSITVNGSSKTVTTDLSSIDGANPRPTVYVTVVVPIGKSIQCHTDW